MTSVFGGFGLQGQRNISSENGVSSSDHTDKQTSTRSTYERMRMAMPGEIFCVDGCIAGKFVVTVLAWSRSSSCHEQMSRHLVS